MVRQGPSRDYKDQDVRKNEGLVTERLQAIHGLLAWDDLVVRLRAHEVRWTTACWRDAELASNMLCVQVAATTIGRYRCSTLSSPPGRTLREASGNHSLPRCKLA